MTSSHFSNIDYVLSFCCPLPEAAWRRAGRSGPWQWSEKPWRACWASLIVVCCVPTSGITPPELSRTPIFRGVVTCLSSRRPRSWHRHDRPQRRPMAGDDTDQGPSRGAGARRRRWWCLAAGVVVAGLCSRSVIWSTSVDDGGERNEINRVPAYHAPSMFSTLLLSMCPCHIDAHAHGPPLPYRKNMLERDEPTARESRPRESRNRRSIRAGPSTIKQARR